MAPPARVDAPGRQPEEPIAGLEAGFEDENAGRPGVGGAEVGSRAEGRAASGRVADPTGSSSALLHRRQDGRGGDREGGPAEPAEPAEAGAGRGEAPAGKEAATGDGERGTGKDIGVGQSGYEEDRKEGRHDGRQHLADPPEPVSHRPSRN